MHFNPGVPDGLRDGVGQLLHPRPVGAPPVVELRGRIDDELGARRRLRPREAEPGSAGTRARCRHHRPAGSRAAGPGLGRGAAETERVQPLVFTAQTRHPRVLEHGGVVGRAEGRGLSGRIRHLEQQVLALPRVEDRVHERLAQCQRAARQVGVAPRLERVVAGQHPARGRSGLVEVRRDGDRVPDIPHGGRETSRGGQRVRRVGPGHDQRAHLAALHPADQRLHVGEAGRGPAWRARAREDRTADRIKHLVEQRYGRVGLPRVRALRLDARRNRDGGRGRRQFFAQRPDPVCGYAGSVRDRLGRHALGPRGESDAPCRSDDARDRQRDLPFGSGTCLDPFVRVGACQRHARADERELRVPMSLDVARHREPGRNLRGREPRPEEVRSEAGDPIRRGQIEPWESRPAAHIGGARGKRLVGEGLVRDVLDTHHPGPVRDELRAGSSHAAGHEHGIPDPHRVGQRADCRLPRRILERRCPRLGGRVSLKRRLHSIGIVQILKRRVRQRREPGGAAGQPVVGSERQHAAIAHLGVDRHRLGAGVRQHRRIGVRDPGGDPLFLDQVGDQLVGEVRGSTGGQRRRTGARGSEHLEEGSP